MSVEQLSGESADRIRLSYRPDPSSAASLDEAWNVVDSDWIRERMIEDTYLTYLRRAHGGRVAVGDEWEEFVNCGCADPEDVIVRVEAVEGGTVFDEATTVEIEPADPSKH
jgi:hypothetical protein